jgi:ring-1,2-phenylacetyl-CoA epoxidase subunit PaaE
LVSNYINDTLKVGDTIEVMPPDGRFFANVKKKQYKTYYLFAAGSGITPILSILKSVLYVEERSYIHMIYGNSHQDSIMFKAELDQLQKQYPDRFLLVHSLSKAKSSWFSSKTDFEYRKGRVDKDAVKWMIDTYPPYAQNVEYYICGPGKMIENTEKALQNLDVPKDRIFKESFGGGDEKVITDGVENAQLSARLNGKNISTSIKKGTTVLRALIDAGEDPPYSCESGVCSTCICQVTKGEVEMKKNFALEDKEVAKGYVLSCQSVPLTEEVEVVFE